MNQWIYEPEDDMLVYVGETQAIFIKIMRETGEYFETIEDDVGNVLTSLTGQLSDLSPELLSLCTT